MKRDPVIITERLWLCEFHEYDAECFFHLNNDHEVMKYTGDVAFDSIEASRKFIQAYDHYEQQGFGRWTLIERHTEAIIGWCGLKYHEDEDYVDLGYRLLRSFWGRGYATEAARACISFGFDQLGMNLIVGRTAQENTGSIRVLEKSGMKFWKYAPCEGIEDSVFYRITRDV